MLDEVQFVKNFEDVLNSFLHIKNADVYVTGSNAKFLSSDIIIEFRGRGDQIYLSPLSFKEYRDYYNVEGDEKLYLKYINNSSFPYALKLESQEEVDEYLENIYNTIIIKDIALRKKITDIAMLKSITEFLFSSVGSVMSVKKIADTLTTNGRKISVHTVENYLDALTESYIFNKVSRYDIKGKQYLETCEKYYATDVAMRYVLLGRKNLDLGHMLENIVYLELKRRGYKVYIGKIGENEVDFVAENKEGKQYFQVAYTTRDKKTLERELTSLQKINDHYPKYILTMDVDPIVDYDGIKKMNVLDWLLDK